MARFMPLAPVGGTMWAASPARNSRPCCIGSTTKLRIAVMPFCSSGPSASGRVPPSRAMQFVPDARVRPVLDIVVGRALQVEPRQRRRAHGVKRKAALVIGVDQLVVGRRQLRQDAEPAERIFAVVGREHAAGMLGRQMP